MSKQQSTSFAQPCFDEQEKYEAIGQALQKLAREGLIVDTGRRRWSKRTRSYQQIVWAKAPGNQRDAEEGESDDPKMAEYRGRIVKTGDGALVEFASAVDATRCAMEIQRAMAERNAPIPEDRRVEFRIGTNVGDIIIDEGDIYGDGVNIAARVESLVPGIKVV